eukprot:TRINITY_DN4101_c0_g1_i2.p1 TRINITY_DN4101_c0_g1~~TRINITY_DN4101_c0_g1_i2.p1  ORF type:complete len:340 (+),score=46.20 TRINITY_DN4101_c0_g1_i2:119-1138(+)
MQNLMRAVVAVKPGAAREVLQIFQREKPSLGKEDGSKVIVKIKATALNRADIQQRKGSYPPPPGESDVFGLEMSGVIEQVGDVAKEKWKIGDRVCALLGSGGYADYIKLDGDVLMHIPSHLSFEEAAAIPEVWLTAYQALVYLGEMDTRYNNKTVLIHAGASGVGTAAIQIVKALGSGNRVFVTAGSQEKIDFCKKLGADEGFNYKTEDFATKVLEATNNKGVDMLMDFMGASYWNNNLKSLGTDGIMTMQALMGGAEVSSNIAPILQKRLQIKGSTLRSRTFEYKVKLTRDFERHMMPKFNDRTIHPVISKVFPLEQVAEAHEFMESDANTGKIILSL